MEGGESELEGDVFLDGLFLFFISQCHLFGGKYTESSIEGEASS